MTLFHRFRVQQEHKNLLFISSSQKMKSDKMKNRICLKFVIKLFNIVTLYCHDCRQTHYQKLTSRQCKYVVLSFIFLCLFLDLQPTGLAYQVEPSNLKSVISLRQVAVPVFSSRNFDGYEFKIGASKSELGFANQIKDTRKLSDYYSPNNRGFEPKSSFRFGERTRYPISIFKSRQKSGNRRDETSSSSTVSSKLKDRVVWSQPDPRKTYSIPMELVEYPRLNERRELLGQKLKIGEYPSQKLLATSVATVDDMTKQQLLEIPNMVDSVNNKPSARQDNQSSSPTNSYLVSDKDNEQSLWRSVKDLGGDTTGETKTTANRRKSYQQTNMVTLIRYLPVLMSVPAEQVVVAPASPDKLPPGSSAEGSLRASTIKTSNSNQVNSDESLVSSTTSSPLTSAAATYYRLYRPALPVKYQQLPNQQFEDLSGLKQSNIVEVSSTISPPNQSIMSPPVQTNNLVSDFEIPPEFAASSLSAAEYPQAAGIFIQQAGNLPPQDTNLSPFISSKFSHLNPVTTNQQIAHHNTYSGPSKAISAYASKLISMLRPSSLLASIGPSAASSAPSAAYYPMSSMKPQIYLLAPAETVVQHQPSRPSSSQSLKPEDLLLNQASKLHSTTKLSSYSQQPQQQQQQQPQRQQNSDWIHQQPNGLICVHSLVHGGSKMLAHVTNQEQKLSVSEHQTTTTNAPTLSQQITDVDQSSFDYIPAPFSTTEYTPISSKQQRQQQQKQSSKIKFIKQNSAYFDKESPVKLAQKLSKKQKTSQVSDFNSFNSSGLVVQEQLNEDFGDKQAHQQQSFLGSSSESRSVIDENQAEARKSEVPSNKVKNKSQVMVKSERIQSQSQNNVSSLMSSRKSVIPFTIKDKIDLPSRRGHYLNTNRYSNATLGSLHSHTNIVAQLNTNNPVEYDEPSEGEIELQTGNNGKHQRQLQKYSWPAHLLTTNNGQQQQQDDRRAKTSFISSSSLSQQRPPRRRLTEKKNLPLELNNIDYSKESSDSNGIRAASALDAGYTLPLLMASSTSLGSSSSPRGRHSTATRKQQHHPLENKYFRGSQRGLAEFEIFDHYKDRRHEAEASNEMEQPEFMRPSVVFRAPPPTTTPPPVTTTFPPIANPESSSTEPSITTKPTLGISNEMNGLNADASSSVTTSSTLDGQPVTLRSGRLSGNSQTIKLGASIDSNESPTGFMLVSSSSLSSSSSPTISMRNDNVTTSVSSNNRVSTRNSLKNKHHEQPTTSKVAPNQTVELLVNSSPHDPQESIVLSSQQAANVVKRRYSTEGEDEQRDSLDVVLNITQVPLERGLKKSSQTYKSEIGDKNSDNTKKGGNDTITKLDNHSLDASNDNKAYSNIRLVSPDSSAEDFAKLSESLQTNPLDLIDLQNSRSSFELPSQLESLSMLFSSESPEQLSSIKPNYRHQHEHQNQNQNQASLLLHNSGWFRSDKSARHRRATGQSHVRRLR